MEVILSKSMPQLGKIGDVVKVKDGYARNFLIPKKIAFEATATNIKRIEQRKLKALQEYEREKQQAQELADKLSNTSCTVAVEVNDLEKLYGSVTDVDIVQALEVEGFQMDKKAIFLDKPIEELGIFEVEVKLHPEVSTKVRVWVTKK